MQQSTCLKSMFCESDGSFQVEGCNYGPWSEWSNCPVTCGVGVSFRKRFFSSTTKENVQCEDFQMENSKCMTSQSCQDVTSHSQQLRQGCEWGEWSGWTPCSETCGMGVKTRQRNAYSPLGADRDCSSNEVEKEVCVLQDNCDVTVCEYREWGEWMPCSSTCGMGSTIRKRFLDNPTNKNSSCESFEMEKNICSVPCPTTARIVCKPRAWSQWSECSQECSQSCVLGRSSARPVQRRTRSGEGCDPENQDRKCRGVPRCPAKNKAQNKKRYCAKVCRKIKQKQAEEKRRKRKGKAKSNAKRLKLINKCHCHV